jgi:hypothetical protein
MLSKSDIEKLSELTKIPAEKLSEAISSQTESTLEFPEVMVFTKEELTSRDIQNGKKAGNTGVEMAVKEMRAKLVDEFGEEYNFQGKTMDNLYETVKKAAIEAGKKEAGVKPNEALQEKQKTIEKLQKTIETMEQDHTSKLSAKEKELNQILTETKILGVIPQGLDTTLKHKQIATLFKAEGYETAIEDGEEVVKLNGEVVRDEKSQKAKKLSDIMNEFLTTQGIGVKQQTKGRGEGDKGRQNSSSDLSGIRTSKELNAYFEANEITSVDDKTKAVIEVRKTNPEFIYEG